jgi:predicted dehydrogenase
MATEQFGCRWFADYREMLSEVEAVCIAVPTLLHHPVGLACLQAGLHVLIEKPIAASQDEATALINAAHQAHRLLQVGHIERFNPAFRELIKVVANEEVVVLEGRRHSPHSDRANDVSVVLDLMIHDIDLVLELAQAPVVRLAAAGGRSAEGPIDYVNATLGFENGVVASLTASKMSHRKIRSLSAHCRSSLVETIFSITPCTFIVVPMSGSLPIMENCCIETMDLSKRSAPRRLNPCTPNWNISSNAFEDGRLQRWTVFRPQERSSWLI